MILGELKQCKQHKDFFFFLKGQIEDWHFEVIRNDADVKLGLISSNP